MCSKCLGPCGSELLFLTVPCCWCTGHSDNDTDFISALTGLFKDIATAVEENHDLLLTSFGATYLVDFTLGLQAECDVQVGQGGNFCTSPVIPYMSAADRMLGRSQSSVVKRSARMLSCTCESWIIAILCWCQTTIWNKICICCTHSEFLQKLEERWCAWCRVAASYRGTLTTRSCSV